MEVITDQMVEVAKRAGRAAGRQLVAQRGDVIGTPKGIRDLVTNADYASEKAIIAEVSAAFPEHKILSEEGGGANNNAHSDYTWIIDPLDGTRNYFWGVPINTVSIALAYQRKPCVGVVYDPWRDELFWAATGRGAYLNDTRVHVAEREQLCDAVVSTDFGHKSERVEMALALATSLLTVSLGARSLGSAALCLSYVASGRLDAYFNYGLNSWDMAAGAVLVTEAGGRMSNLLGGDDYLFTRGCLGTNGYIHDEILAAWKRDRDLIPTIELANE